MSYQVIFSREAAEDLERLFDHLLDRELHSPTGDLDIPVRAIKAIEQACQLLAHSPFSCRKAGTSALVRELIITFGHSGYVALFEIRDGQKVVIGAVRHQYESDYH
ncbi:MAG: type II toxin-antitoxin system RelE/ParE family toxin [Giesbergeria sp.]|jgi:plasmid stabilization system protein ParE|nr:type II toxin-antitoxin system RelE/ParE family toxin [Simplicispira sp.]